MNVTQKLKKGFILLDGGMGTELQKRGLAPGELPETWNVKNPDIVTEIHKKYFAAGSDIVATNTFGANSLKFGDDLEKIISSAVKCAKKAAKEYEGIKPRFVGLDVGPLGKMLKPLGELDFEKAVEIFAETIKIGVRQGVDLIMIETMNDSNETKAAVLAAKENCNLPNFVTNVYDETHKLMTGADPLAMVSMLEGLKVDALGLNCSLGPAEMKDIVKELISYSSIPVIVKPNAGLPTVVNGETVFNVTPEDFASEMFEISNMGATVLGGCCGTNPEYIRALSEKIKSAEYKAPREKDITVVSSYTHGVIFGEKHVLIGERINPTGKKRFKQALIENDMSYILNEGIRQEEAGVDILDVNVGLPEIDEADFMERTVAELGAVTDLPLQIDTALTSALEKGLRLYNGKPMINSVNGKKESMEAVFPLAAKYGGVVVALTLDERGIPATAEERVEIAKNIISVAESFGIKPKDIIVDPLAMAVSADNNAAVETLKAVSIFKHMGIKTSLGVSNISFGLPNRDFITSTFFAMALSNGLNAAIMNPYSLDMLKVYRSYLALIGKDEACAGYIEFAGKITTSDAVIANEVKIDKTSSDGLFGAIVKGLKSDAANYTAELLKTTEPMEVINGHIIPALDEVGKGFEEKRVYLPQLLMSAEAATTAFGEVKKCIKKAENGKGEKIILATVKGDIHDIGKNIVKVLLENYGFEVIDLGRDVPPEKIVDTALKEGARLVGLSALMTTTVPAMEETVKMIKDKSTNIKTMVGGAVLTKEYADSIGADFYGKTAMDSVRYAEKLFRG